MTGTEMSTKFPNGLNESSNSTGVMGVSVAVVFVMMASYFGMRVGVFGGYNGVDEADTGSGIVTESGGRFSIGMDGAVLMGSGDGTEMSGELLLKAGMRWIRRVGAGTAFLLGSVRCSSIMFISSCA